MFLSLYLFFIFFLTEFLSGVRSDGYIGGLSHCTNAELEMGDSLEERGWFQEILYSSTVSEFYRVEMGR